MTNNKSHTALQGLFGKERVSQLIALRRDLHQDPELAWQEHRTADRLYEELAALHPGDLQRVAGTGVVARFRGREAGRPVTAIRGDIDALPIQEATGLAFSSRNDSVMHACGHDVHATWTIAAAHLLAQHPPSGDVVVILQPAEEIGAGARAVLDSGLLEDVTCIFGGHVDRRYRVGEVVAQEGPLAASSDSFEIELTGTGAHGARPHEAIDPIVGAAGLVTALQTAVSRSLNPADPGVVTVGAIHGGSAPNIIPEKVQLCGTIRAIAPQTRSLLKDEVQRIAQAQAAAFQLGVSVKLGAGTPPIVNPKEPVRYARQAVSSVLGEAALTSLESLNMGGEDFACYMEHIPGCFMRIGAREEGGDVIPAHSPRFYAPEESIFIAGAVLAECARQASNCGHQPGTT